MLVKDFQNKPLTECPKDVISDTFLPLNDVENIVEFCNRIHTLPTRSAHEAFQEMLMASLAESNVGIYSTCHDRCVAMSGYGHAESIRLAYMYVNITSRSPRVSSNCVSVATLLDSSKTGRRLRPGILDKDRKTYWTQLPFDNKSFILEGLKVAGRKKGEELLGQHREAGSKLHKYKNPDSDLEAPYNTAAAHALEVFTVTKKKDFTDELALIRKHVDHAKKSFDTATFRKEHQPSPKSKRGLQIKSDQDVTLKAAQEYADPIKNILLIRNVEEVKASYACMLNINFAFSVAFNQLCLIKAVAASEGIAPSRRIFDEGKTFNPSFLRALPRCENESGLPSKD